MKRIAIAVYGLFAYLAFLMVFLYLIGFVWNLAVPKGIDAGEPILWPLALIINTALLTLFGMQHSVMARPGFKRWWKRIVPDAAERSTYVLVASVVLGFAMWAWQPMPYVLWDVSGTMAGDVLFSISAVGWLLVLVSTFNIDHFQLFGLKQAAFFLLRRKVPAPAFLVRGFYHLVRHPLMLGFLVAFWATPTMTAGHLTFAAVMTGYIMIALRYEERDLVDELGQAYLDYMDATPMLNPVKSVVRAITAEKGQRDRASDGAPIAPISVEREMSGPVGRP